MIPAMVPAFRTPNVSSFLYDDVAVPPGLTFMDLYAAARLVWNFEYPDGPEPGEPCNEFELVARVYECLAEAAARNAIAS
jgi:hypothetical protein